MKKRVSILDLPPEERDALRRKRQMIGAGIIALMLALLFFIEYMVWDFRGTSGIGNLLYFTLINVNVILSCILLFLILRNLTKLLFERRQKVLGARLRTRLVFAFTSFALVPTILLFYVAMTFITNSIERWFTLLVEESLNESMEVAQRFYQITEERSALYARNIAAQLSENPHFQRWLAQGAKPATPAVKQPATPADETDQPAEKKGLLAPASTAAEDFSRAINEIINDPGKLLTEELEKIRALVLVEAIEIYANPAAKPLLARGREVKAKEWPQIDPEHLKKSFLKATDSRFDSVDEGELVRGMAAARDKKGRTVAVVVVDFLIPKTMERKLHRIQATHDGYKQMQVFEPPIRSNYFIILGMISLFIFFSATWFGFYLARQITEPIQQLAEGARQVAAGEMAVRIEKTGSDEIGTLVDAFNKMLEDLETSRGALEHAMEDLEASNVELERRRTSMEAILNHVGAGVLSFDETGRVQTINPSAERILGIKVVESRDKTWEDVFPPNLAAAFQRLGEDLVRGKRKTVQGQLEINVASEIRTVLAVMTVIQSNPGAPSGVVLVVEDLTELLKAQRVGAWQEIARRIAHEIKNPLTPIQLAAQRLRKRYGSRFDEKEDEVFFDSTGVIIRQVEELKRMVEEFSSFSRMAVSRPSPTDIGEVIREAVILYSEAHKHIHFEARIDNDVPRMMLDRDQIKRSLINVIDNAVASIEGKGSIEVTARLSANLQVLILQISDTGTGLSKAYRSRLFEPYFSTKKMGTGLGLAIVHRIVSDHDGHIHLKDNKPRGTIVTIELPVRVVPETPVEKSGEEETP